MTVSTAYVLQQALNALQLAAFYLPLAIGFAIIQAVTRRIFLSLGDFAMFGSFAAIYACFDAMVHGASDLWAGITGLGLAILSGAALGIVVSRLMLSRELMRNPLAFMIGSIGLAIFLQELMRLQSGSADVWIPPLLSGQEAFHLSGIFPVRLGLLNGLAIFVSLAAAGFTWLLLGANAFGRKWRAVSQHPVLASLCGVDLIQIMAGSFALAGALAGVTGWTSSIVYGGANFSIGLMAGFKAMFASVVGGFGTVRGAVAGAIILAIAEVAWSAAFSTAYRDVAVFAIIIAMLVLRPEGLLGQQQKEIPMEQEP